MLDTLDQADKSLLLDINSYHNSFLDTFMYLISERWMWVPMYASLLYTIIKSKKSETFFIIVGVAITVLLCDQFSSSICKPFFQRFRPSQDPQIGELVHLVCGFKCDLYGFISAHAANTIGIAMFLTLLFKNRTVSSLLFLWALLNCYSRIYMGVHYPGDVICGALTGFLFGWVGYYIYGLLIARMPQFRYIKHRTNSRSNVDFMLSDFCPFMWTLAVTLFIIALLSSKNMVFC